MKFKKSMILIILAVFLFAIASVGASDVNDTAIVSEDAGQIEWPVNDDTLQTIEENPTLAVGDNDETVSAETDSEILTDGQYTYSDLRAQIGSGGNINLTKGTYTYNNDGDTIEINTPGVINGNGAVIDMAFSGIQALNVYWEVTIKNLTIKNVDCYGDGGAIYFYDPATVENCNFINNKVTGGIGRGAGGALYFHSFGIVKNCNFTDNEALGGDVDKVGGGAVYFLDKGTVTNCNFTNNKARESSGGAVYFSDTGTVTNCNFTDNYAIHGGAVCFNETDNSMANCSFTDNTAHTMGGAVCFIYLGTGEIINCNFTNNSAHFGGAVYLTDMGTVTNCSFTDNTATNGGDGGAVYFLFNCIVTNCNFTNNSAHFGGAVYFISTGDVANCNFVNNTASDHGGAIYFRYSHRPSTITNCNFTGNNATQNGGAVYFNEDTTGEIINCNFIGNNATVYGGAVYFWSSGEVTNCSFTDNSADDKGGAIYFNGGNSEVSSCIFVNNSANDYGAVHLSFGNSVISSCVFMNNSANKGVVGAAWDSFVSMKISNNIFLNNEVNQDVIDLAYFLNLTTDYNWFGNNADDYDAEVPSATSNVWLFLNATAGNDCIPYLGSSVIVFKLYAYNKTNISTFDYDNSLLYPVYLSIYAMNGTVDKEDILLGDSIKFTATDFGIGRVTAEIGNVGQSIELKIIKANSTLTISNDISFSYAKSGSATVSFTNATGINASVIGQSNAVVNVKGNTITVSGLDVGTYTLSVTTVTDENHNPVTETAKITVDKLKTELSASAITTTYDINKYLVITLKDDAGKALTGVKVTVDLNGAKEYATDSNGQVKVSTKGLVPKTYTAKVTFNGNTNYAKSTKDIKVTVKKATPKITAKKKTYKVKATKKFTIVLKDNTGKPIKNAKVRLIVKKITKKTKKTKTKSKKKYKKNIVKTNKKGKATFKIDRSKKGKYIGTIKFYGNKYYTVVTKKVKITIK